MPPDYQLPVNNDRTDLQYSQFSVPVVPSHATLRASYYPSIVDRVAGPCTQWVQASQQYVAHADDYRDLYPSSTGQPISTEKYAYDLRTSNVPCPVDCVMSSRCMEEGGEPDVSYGPDPPFSDCHTWVVHSMAPVHIPQSWVTPSECGPPNEQVVGSNDCCFQPGPLSSLASTTPSPTSGDIPTPVSPTGKPIHTPIDKIQLCDRDRVAFSIIDRESVPIVSASSGKWRCEMCERVFRRRQRALIHFLNKHEGLRLYCNRQCGKSQCNKSFACQEGLDMHLNPVEITCESCGRNLLKKNILRHQREHCHPLVHSFGIQMS